MLASEYMLLGIAKLSCINILHFSTHFQISSWKILFVNSTKLELLKHVCVVDVMLFQPSRLENQELRAKLQQLQEKSEGTMTSNNKDELTSLGEEKIENDKEIKEVPVTEKKERNVELTQEQVKR